MKLKQSMKYFNRRIKKSFKHDISEEFEKRLKSLREYGYVIIDNLFSKNELEVLQNEYRKKIELDLAIEFPCLAQSKIDPIKHQNLIDNHFLFSPRELHSHGVSFNRSEVRDYRQIIDEFKPSTLKTSLEDIPSFFQYWLHPVILDLIEAYNGFRPYLTEAYIRRNFPAKYRVMNHFWHRDRNSRDPILKAFIFLSDCKLENGPHEYIAGSIQDRRLDNQNYYSDSEVDNIYPEDCSSRIRSIVPAGTVILEDTRGLHRASIPFTGFRDLGYAIFLPRPFYLPQSRPTYFVRINDLVELSSRQIDYIPSNTRI